MLDKMPWLQRHGGDLRRYLLYEPRGYPNLFANLMLPSTPPAPGDHAQESADLGGEARQHRQEREIDADHRVAARTTVETRLAAPKYFVQTASVAAK